MHVYNTPPRIQIDLNPNKSKWDKSSKKTNRQGVKPCSNVKFGYDFAPIIKWTFIIFSIFAVAGIFLKIYQQRTIRDQEKVIKTENDAARKKYLEGKLEAIKQDTIAAEQIRIAIENHQVLIEKTMPISLKKEVQVYSWINKNGNRVYSNKKPVH